MSTEIKKSTQMLITKIEETITQAEKLRDDLREILESVEKKTVKKSRQEKATLS